MGLFDRFKKQKIDKSSAKEKGREKKKKDQDKFKKEREEALKKQQFMAVPSAGREKKKEEAPKEKEPKAKTPKKPRKTETREAYRLLIRPIITEKATALGVSNQYVFEVKPGTNKIEVKKAIEALYEVSPIKVNIMNRQGKNVRYGRYEGRTKKWKKAVITLKQGEKIDVYNT